MVMEARQLAVERLVKSYSGRRVVDQVSFTVEQGRIIGLLGPNGAGKTTTFLMLVGLIAPEAGRVLLDGREITRLPFHRRARLGINYLPQEPSAFRKLTVRENLWLILENMVPEGDRHARLEELLERFSLTHLARRTAGTLSAGERRRVEIARALAAQPSFLLLDEPFTGIDPLSIEELQNIIRELHRDGLGIMLTDHNVRETLKITDYAYLMNEGRILVSGTPEEIIADPQARRFYLGEDFRL